MRAAAIALSCSLSNAGKCTITCGSAFRAAKASRSALRHGRNTNRSVVRVGKPFDAEVRFIPRRDLPAWSRRNEKQWRDARGGAAASTGGDAEAAGARRCQVRGKNRRASIRRQAHGAIVLAEQA